MEKKSTSNSSLAELLKGESTGGILLVICAIIAIIIANSPLVHLYDAVIATKVNVSVGDFKIDKPLLLWINDGLMALFFFLVGLELKREFLEGELSKPQNIVMPAVGAAGGMIAPALIFVAFNYGDSFALQGWAIPAATDIAFALGVLSLLGSRVPLSLKVFLTSLAIFDDVGAIIIIALFYSHGLSIPALIWAIALTAILFVLHRCGTNKRLPFLVIGVALWVAMLKSGIHATLAGVLLAFFIPNRPDDSHEGTMLKSLEHNLHAVVPFVILPIFALANSGVRLVGMSVDQMVHDVPVGIALGLFLGKQVGVFGFCWAAIKLKITEMPKGMDFGSLYGTAALCGIGFTMSLFIGSLAFHSGDATAVFDERVGIIAGSVASGILGYFLLRATLKPIPQAETDKS